MSFINFVGFALCCIVVYICIWCLVDRICRCFEFCATAKSNRKLSDEIDNKLNAILEELKKG